MNSERHPLEPFLPSGARLLMLGSFPPQRHRWSMEFFYPNLQNDMWRIVGYLATGDKTHFLMPDAKRFDKERIEAFCRERGIALYDTAAEVIRLKDNASDNFLQVWRRCWPGFRRAAPSSLRDKRPPTRCAPSSGAKNLRSGVAWTLISPGVGCVCGGCLLLRGPIRAPSNGKPNSIARYSPTAG